jgi:hypothetical protein
LKSPMPDRAAYPKAMTCFAYAHRRICLLDEHETGCLLEFLQEPTKADAQDCHPFQKVEHLMARTVIYSIVIFPTMAIGGFMMLRSLGVFGPIATTPDGPAWLGVLMGFVFFAGGASALIKLTYGAANMQQSELPAQAPSPARLFYNCLGVTIVAGLGALFGWIALGPGERHFSGSGAFLGPILGRVMFGLAAAMALLMLVVMGIRWFRRQR